MVQQMLNHPDGGAIIDEGLRALAHRGRRAMVRACLHHETSASDLADAIGLSRPAASQHLGVLLQAGLLRVRRDGRMRLYRTDPAVLDDIRSALADFWEPRLAALKREAER
jgi:DNA-binding transcriptional ArsR family regulator